VASFGIATNFTWTDSAGAKQTKAEFHNIVAWRKLAEICGQYLKKGAKVFIEGRIQTREWEGEDGTKRYRTEIVADNMIMLDGRKGDAGSFGGAREAAGIKEPEAQGDQIPAPDGEVKIDDLPF
jgi:single-strand DNA-binding protein